MNRLIRRLLSPLAGGLAALAVAVPAAFGGVPRALPPGTAFTPLTVSLITTPTPVKAVDGRTHLSYELFVTNAAGSATAVRLNRVTVRDAGTRKALGSLGGAALAAAANPVGGTPAGGSDTARVLPRPTVLAGSTQWVVWIDLALDASRRLPQQVEHELDATLLSPSGAAVHSVRETVARTRLATRPPLDLAAPVRPGDWYVSEGCCDNTHHRRGLAPVNGVLDVPQRFAVDWFRVGPGGRTWRGDPGRLASYLSFRQPVQAAAAGRVVEVQDGIADNPPPVPPVVPPIQDTVGNHVTLEVAPGRYLLYAHLERGSITVRRGQRVGPGQILGLIGNSGNSTTPHLHFQVMTTREFFPTDSPPFTFRGFVVLGQVRPRIWDDNLGLQLSGVLPVSPSPFAGRHCHEMPLDRNVIRF
ncbi:M23 family metallopeptidase [Streptacidiphilus anmyonensis]|uniref:M23 family metallopeptidase n=1 Tax=Streptacidiphilus anmyonensis TaxID=405782 RepID=UPI0009FD2855|nr:M23 family metallopeptidase [Streptacidiphilus anmyonensis]